MKTRRLSEIDLARLAALPAGPQLEHALRAYNSGGGAWSYEPVRASTSDILGAETPLLGRFGPPPWSKIKRQIELACRRGAAQVNANTEVGKVLFEASRKLNWSAANVPMGRLPIGMGESVRYWCDIVLEDAEGQFIPYFDHRRGLGITNAGMRQIVFSMQHIWVRDRNPDLAGARLAVIQFPQERESRSVRVWFQNDTDLLSYEELNARVRLVYETWARVSAEKTHDARRAGGGATPFGF